MNHLRTTALVALSLVVTACGISAEGELSSGGGSGGITGQGGASGTAGQGGASGASGQGGGGASGTAGQGGAGQGGGGSGGDGGGGSGGSSGAGGGGGGAGGGGAGGAGAGGAGAGGSAGGGAGGSAGQGGDAGAGGDSGSGGGGAGGDSGAGGAGAGGDSGAGGSAGEGGGGTGGGGAGGDGGASGAGAGGDSGAGGSAGNPGECTTGLDCPGVDDECKQRTCNAGVCGVTFTAKETPVAVQVDGDCKVNVCDGAGNIVSVNDDSDAPGNQGACIAVVCDGGAPAKKEAPAGAGCNEDNGNVCNGAGKCVSTFVVVRVGTGTGALNTNAAAVFLEERLVSDGSLLAAAGNPVALPTSGAGRFSLAGDAASEGNLSRSLDGKFLVLAGYDADAGAANVRDTDASAVNRKVARLDRGYNLDTSTRLATAFKKGNPRSACTDDGTKFWVTGHSDGGGSTGGVWMTTLGSTNAGTRVIATPNNVRFCHFYFGQFFGSASSTPFNSVFEADDAIPTTENQNATTLGGLPNTGGPSVYSFVVLDTNSDGKPDLLYFADDRTNASGGIYKWVSADGGANWTAGNPARIAASASQGVRGLAGFLEGKVVTLLATLANPNGNTLVKVTDDLDGGAPLVVDFYKTPVNTVLRGVALGPR